MFFRDIDPETLRDTVVFLDIDGTLVPNSESELMPAESFALSALAKTARVFLVSNHGMRREPAMVLRYGVDAIVSPYKKPDTRILRGVSLPDAPRVMIGDKFLTDGLFARGVGAKFIRVERLLNGQEPLWARMADVLDDAVWFFVSAFSALFATTLWQFVKLARPKQWIKNLLILTPLFFAGGFFSWPALYSAILGAVAFSLIASAGYVVNDISDREEDALHPKKRMRPIASGAVSVFAGIVFAGALFLSGAFFATLVPNIVPWLVLYGGLQYFYSSGLRAVPVLEFLAVSSFFVIRILAGDAVAEVPVSGWLILTTFFAALFVTVGKRYSESQGSSTRAVLRAYPALFLQMLPALSAVLAIVAYALYSVLGTSYHELVFSNIFVVFGILWYLRGIYAGTAEEPETKLWNDLVLLSAVLLWGVFLICVLYGTVLLTLWQSI